MLFWQLLPQKKNLILFWQHYFGNFYPKKKKKPNAILATLTKSPVLFWQLLSKNLNLLDKQLFYQSPNIIWQKNYVTLKAQNYSLAKAYFDILNSLTHGKHKLLMTYYPYFKTISSTKFMGTMLIFSIRNSNYKSPYILQTHGKTIHFVRMNKPKKANNKSQPR